MANLVPVLCVLIFTICHTNGKPTESVVSSCPSCEKLAQFSKKFNDLLSIKEVRDSIVDYSGPLGICTDNDELVTSPPDQELTVDPECMLCKRVFEQIYAYLQENRTQEAIEDALDKVCDDIFPSSHKKSCRKFVDSYTAQIIDIVLQTTDPKEACIILGVCKPKIVEYSSDSGEEVEEIVEVIPLTPLGSKAEKMKMTSKDECDRCDRMMHIIGKYFSDESYIKEGEEEKMPEKKNSTSTNAVEINHEVEGKPRLVCAECLIIAKEIQSKIYNHKTEEDITKFITNDLCRHFPNHEIKESCKYFVSEYGESVMQMIALKVFDPHTLCSKELKLCSKLSHETELESSPAEFDFIDKKIEETCSVCVDMVKRMELLKDGEDKTKSLCSHYEQSEKNQKCLGIFDAFGKHFEKMIAFDSAEKICKTVDLCYSSAHSHLLGGQKCSFGPSYWCNTKAHAEACKALDFCRKNKWMPIE